MSTLEQSLAAMLGSAELDACLSVDDRPLPVAAPAEEAQLLELLALARRDHLTVIPIGSGAGLELLRPDARPDFLLSTRHLSGILAHEPGDGTLAARAGTPLGELARRAADGGQHLSPRLRHAPSATLGGVLAAGRAGPDRLRWGPARHQVLGTRMALSDGTVAASGGRLVKNVAGYDLHRLHCGSRGTLGIILEACLRLHPAPEASSRSAVTFAKREEALEAAAHLRDGPLRPWALLLEESTAATVDGDHARPWTLHLELGGVEEVHRAELDWAREALAARAGQECPPATGENLDRWADGRAARLTVTCRPSKLRAVCPLLSSLVPGPQIILPAMAQVHILGEGPPPTAAEGHSLALRLAPQGARITGHKRAGEAGADWAQRLRQALDPSGVFADTGAAP